MKHLRITAAAAALALLLGSAPLPAAAGTALPDLNNDGYISVDDAALVCEAAARTAAGLETELTDAQMQAADVDGDGHVDARDGRLILEYFASIMVGNPEEDALEDMYAYAGAPGTAPATHTLTLGSAALTVGDHTALLPLTVSDAEAGLDAIGLTITWDDACLPADCVEVLTSRSEIRDCGYEPMYPTVIDAVGEGRIGLSWLSLDGTLEDGVLAVLRITLPEDDALKKSCDFTVSTTLWQSVRNHTAYSYGDVHGSLDFVGLGDVNMDGVIDAADASLVCDAAARTAAGLETELTDAQMQAADVDKNGHVDAGDGALILRYADYAGRGVTGTFREFLQAAAAAPETKPGTHTLALESRLLPVVLPVGENTALLPLTLSDVEENVDAAALTVTWDAAWLPADFVEVLTSGKEIMACGYEPMYRTATAAVGEGRIGLAYSGFDDYGMVDGTLAVLRITLPVDYPIGEPCTFTVTTTLWENTAEHIAYECGDVQGSLEMYVPGDVNMNGGVNAIDASYACAAAARIAAGLETELTEAQMQAADVDKNGLVDARDATLILHYAAFMGIGGSGTIDSFLQGYAAAPETKPCTHTLTFGDALAVGEEGDTVLLPLTLSDVEENVDAVSVTVTWTAETATLTSPLPADCVEVLTSRKEIEACGYAPTSHTAIAAAGEKRIGLCVSNSGCMEDGTLAVLRITLPKEYLAGRTCSFTVSTTLWESTADHIAYECGDVQTDIRFYCKGDVNGDGAVTAADAQMLARVLETQAQMGTWPLNIAQHDAADVSGDARVNETDLERLSWYLRYVETGGRQPLEEYAKYDVTIWGDADLDGDCDILDVIAVNKDQLGSKMLDTQGAHNADADTDGAVSFRDAVHILRSLVDLASLPVTET